MEQISIQWIISQRKMLQNLRCKYISQYFINSACNNNNMFVCNLSLSQYYIWIYVINNWSQGKTCDLRHPILYKLSYKIDDNSVSKNILCIYEIREKWQLNHNVNTFDTNRDQSMKSSIMKQILELRKKT